MVQHWSPPREDEKLFFDEQARAHETLRPFNRHAPPPLQNERLDQYERRLTYDTLQITKTSIYMKPKVTLTRFSNSKFTPTRNERRVIRLKSQMAN
jgi:hypothetical protein